MQAFAGMSLFFLIERTCMRWFMEKAPGLREVESR